MTAFVAAEWYAGKLRPAPAPAPVEVPEATGRKLDPAEAARRAAKAAATRPRTPRPH